MAKNSATRDTDFYTRSTMGSISSFYLISRKARFSQVLFIIVTSEKRSRCRRTYRPVCRSTQWVNLRKTRARSREGRARKISRSVWHMSYKSKSISTGRINTSVFFFHNVRFYCIWRTYRQLLVAHHRSPFIILRHISTRFSAAINLRLKLFLQ